MYKLEYDYDNRVIYKTSNNQKEKMNFKIPSEPIVSLDEQNTVFIDPLEWECLSSLYVFNNRIGEFTTLIEPENNYIPKYVKWLNHEMLVIIIGFGFGTIAIGGNVYTYNVINHEKAQITHFDSNVQITSLAIIDSNQIKCKGIKYIDDIQNQFIEFEEVVQL